MTYKISWLTKDNENRISYIIADTDGKAMDVVRMCEDAELKVIIAAEVIEE